MKKILIIFSLGLIFSCENKSGESQRVESPAFYQLEKEDQEMKAAINRARQSLNEFESALEDTSSLYQSFAVKVNYKSKQVWLGDVSIKEGKYRGIVDTLHQTVTEVSEGDTLIVEPSAVTDWMYLENGKLRGGYTIKVLRSRMTEEERKGFDEVYGLSIED